MAPSKLKRFAAAAARRVALLAATVAAAALLATAMARLAPGSGMDERRFDPRRTNDSIAAIEEGSRPEAFLPGFLGYVKGLARGDWGASLSLGRPVRELVRERAGVTLRTLAAGLGMAWTAAMVVCFTLAWVGRRGIETAATVLAGGLLCVPIAAVALLFLYLDRGPPLALAAVLFPRIFRYEWNILEGCARQPHVLAARARGVGPAGLWWRHIGYPAGPELLALAGVSVSMAVGAAIPIEALCDSPGVGQLIWQSAMARDLPVLVHLTVLIAGVTCVANLFADAAREAACAARPA